MLNITLDEEEFLVKSGSTGELISIPFNYIILEIAGKEQKFRYPLVEVLMKFNHQVKKLNLNGDYGLRIGGEIIIMDYLQYNKHLKFINYLCDCYDKDFILIEEKKGVEIDKESLGDKLIWACNKHNIIQKIEYTKIDK
jgi:hypothetical protein